MHLKLLFVTLLHCVRNHRLWVTVSLKVTLLCTSSYLIWFKKMSSLNLLHGVIASDAIFFFFLGKNEFKNHNDFIV